MYGWEPRVLLRHSLDQGLSKTAIAARVGISRRTLYHLARHGRAGGLQAMTGLVPTFFYGLFMDPEILRELGANPGDARLGHVEGLELRVGSRAYLVPVRGARAYGVVMDLSHGDLDRLYSAPAVSAYRPEPVLVQMADGGAHPALCFNLPAPDETVPPDASYVRRLIDISQKLGLPERARSGLPAGP